MGRLQKVKMEVLGAGLGFAVLLHRIRSSNVSALVQDDGFRRMSCTYLGHAGLVIQTNDCCILCDPWHSDNPVFFDSWSPYPANDELDWDSIRRRATVLYVSHCHRDHLDIQNLKLMPDKGIPVLLPEMRFGVLQQDLRAVGFTNFHLLELTVGNTQLTTFVSETTNREMEDSMLLVDDGRNSFLNANDCKMEGHIEADISSRYPAGVDIYAGQYSGAAWHPMCYAGHGTFDAQRVSELCAAHRSKTTKRFVSACKAVKARKCIPTSGPAMFCSEDLIKYNYLGPDDPSASRSIFPDAYQFDFLGLFAEEAAPDQELCRVAVGDQFTFSSLTDTPVDPIPDKLAHIQQRLRPAPPSACDPKLTQKAIRKFELHVGEILYKFGENLKTVIPCNLYLAIDGDNQSNWLELRLAKHGGVVPMTKKEPVEPYYVVRMPEWIFVVLVTKRLWDWEEAFLGLRCRFERVPDRYNPWILALFKNLTLERTAMLCSSLGSTSRNTMAAHADQFFERDGFKIARFCPHQGLDLSVHGRIENGKLKCLGHGFEWDLKTGEGLNNTCNLECKSLEW